MSRSADYLRAISSRTNYVSYYKLGLIADYVERLEAVAKRAAACGSLMPSNCPLNLKQEAENALHGDLT